MKSSLTLRKLLETEYEITDKGYNDDTCLRYVGDEECFYETMRIEIEKKWGRGFLATQQRLADQLDKEGKGYYEPRENGMQELLDRYLAENAPGRLGENGYSVRVKISPEKRIIDLEVLSGGLFAEEPIPRNSWVYTFLKGALDNIPISCEPARLRGKPIESLIYLHAWF
ncbi:hypothetical protein SAMN04488109_1509 [Chryseolinea serpens]|uniref:Uncharacterized protein n=2 Tax=Chryseolinea serpens TaxID=947013 RepID=A0A1M5M1C2_9BACT|nr:hypothetical protein SAMN04488109_1509 [Chryseolinea serpens]